MEASEVLEAIQAVLAGGKKEPDKEPEVVVEEKEEEKQEEKKDIKISEEEEKGLRELKDEELNEIMDRIKNGVKKDLKQEKELESMSEEEKKAYELSQREEKILNKQFNIELKSVCSDLNISKDVASKFLNPKEFAKEEDMGAAIQDKLKVMSDYINQVVEEKTAKVIQEKDAKYLELSKQLADLKTKGETPVVKKSSEITSKPKSVRDEVNDIFR